MSNPSTSPHGLHGLKVLDDETTGGLAVDKRTRSNERRRSYPKRRELAKVARNVFSRFFPNGPIDESAEDLEHDITEEPPMKKSKAEELNDILCQPEDQHLDRVQENVLTHIKNEMTFYEATKECPKVLKSLKSCLNSLPPSSVEAERCFSAAGLFVSKLRSSLSDEMIDSLCFTRSYFVRK